MKTEKETRTRKFLLGKLNEEEQTEIEKAYFSDRKIFEELLIAENELIDAYAAGSLSAEDQKRFESRLLLNPKQRQRIGFAKTLVNYASKQPLDNFDASPAKSSWISVFSRLVSNKPMLSFAFAAAVLVFFIGGIWLTLDKQNPQINQTGELAVVQTPQPAREENKILPETRDSNQVIEKSQPEILPTPRNSGQLKTRQIKETPPKKKTPAIFSFVLSPGLTRDSGTSRRFNIPAKTDLVKIELKFEAENFSSYRAVLETVEGNQVWSSNHLKTKKDGKSVEVSISSKLLKKADYILSVKGLSSEGIYERIEDFTFTINR